MVRIKKVALLLFSVLGILLVATGCGQKDQDKTVKVGISSADAPIWKVVQKQVKKDHIKLKVVEFNDYNQPNTALSQGEVDINSFQHQFFLDAWNKAHHSDIVSIGVTMIQPMAIYSHKLKSLTAIKPGAKVALPNDASNEARALQLLESAGLIRLSPAKDNLPTPKNVRENKLNLKFNVLDAAQTAHSLNDVDFAVVNGNVARSAKLTAKDRIYIEKVSKKSKPWINIIAVQKKNKDNATYKKIVKAYQTEAVLKAVKKLYGPQSVAAWKIKL
ncbi:MetQ/NlpA family ABC transporter substrate-binding protein [Lactobacillus sp. DCY120]|uniref:Lipoprotein n=1 Tax=Bombilactobacillus apium TaxID=2675299 RepID=A0A850R183_9LACO|nr:MetQ/NlpA family ABC transporter substrate-binding protein [Bombilactobacillus apium]NVY95781.1 MetQ/NlpA family ABC transporter substrate-binding protein [Bombilactobacillus apium]